MRKLLLVAFISLLLAGTALSYTYIIRTSSNIDSDDPKFLLSFADFLVKKDMKAQALAVYDKAIELDPENAVLLNNKAYALLGKDDAKAELLFKEALKLDPSYEVAKKNLALLYNKLDRFSESSALFRELAESYPDNVQYSYDLAINLAQKFYNDSRDIADLDESLSYFRRVKEMNPGFEKADENIRVLEKIKALL